MGLLRDQLILGSCDTVRAADFGKDSIEAFRSRFIYAILMTKKIVLMGNTALDNRWLLPCLKNDYIKKVLDDRQVEVVVRGYDPSVSFSTLFGERDEKFIVSSYEGGISLSTLKMVDERWYEGHLEYLEELEKTLASFSAIRQPLSENRRPFTENLSHRFKSVKPEEGINEREFDVLQEIFSSSRMASRTEAYLALESAESLSSDIKIRIKREIVDPAYIDIFKNGNEFIMLDEFSSSIQYLLPADVLEKLLVLRMPDVMCKLALLSTSFVIPKIDVDASTADILGCVSSFMRDLNPQHVDQILDYFKANSARLTAYKNLFLSHKAIKDEMKIGIEECEEPSAESEFTNRNKETKITLSSQKGDKDHLMKITLNETVEYQNSWFQIRQRNGFYYLHEPRAVNAAAIVPITEENCVVFVRQNREAVGKALWEIPRGYSEQNETVLECAARELREETGIDVKVEDIQHIGDVAPNTAVLTSLVGLCVVKLTGELEPFFATGEIDQIGVFGIDEIRRLIKEGEIIDGFTLSAFGVMQIFEPDLFSGKSVSKIK